MLEEKKAALYKQNRATFYCEWMERKADVAKSKQEQ